jgi:hypothetical protein
VYRVKRQLDYSRVLPSGLVQSLARRVRSAECKDVRAKIHYFRGYLWGEWVAPLC